jgi:hypothetical protein
METLVWVGCVDTGGQTTRGGELGENLTEYRSPHRGPLMGRAKRHVGGGPGPVFL